MRTIKKYANGRFYDADNKEYIKKNALEKMIKEDKKVKVVESKSGRDITKTIASKPAASKKKAKKEESFLTPEHLKKWLTDNRKWMSDNIDKVGDNVEKRFKQVLHMMNLPSKEQITKVEKSLKDLNKKVTELEKVQAKKINEVKKSYENKIEEIQKSQNSMAKEIDKRLG